MAGNRSIPGENGRSSLPIVVTMGEPAGIGGELVLKAWQRCRREGPSLLALDDPGRLERLAALLGLPVPIVTVGAAGEAGEVMSRGLPVLPLDHAVPLRLGRCDTANAPAVLESIERAVGLARMGAAAAVVTNPIQKATLYAAGFAYPGHTEYLAALAGVSHPVMMLAAADFRVVLVTIHVPLRRVPELLTRDLIEATALVTDRALRRDFGIAQPRLAVAGLNPHAGEEGSLGREEVEVIGPALLRLRERGLDVRGPLPADTMFFPSARSRYDAALCMYHDQGLAPLKAVAFDQAVNVTLGLPFIRTSPDHGTALDLAGQGVAKVDSLLAAIAMAARLAARRTGALGDLP